MDEVHDRGGTADGLGSFSRGARGNGAALAAIDEPAKTVSPAFREEHPEIPLRKMAFLRERQVHHTFCLDREAGGATGLPG
jgi:hypothetical protein